MTDKLTTKLGKTRAGERTRVWIEGARLTEHGFPHGSKFRKRFETGRLVITPLTFEAFDETPRAERGSVAGTLDRPIIDITGEIVAATFKGTHVNVTYHKNRLTVEG